MRLPLYLGDMLVDNLGQFVFAKLSKAKVDSTALIEHYFDTSANIKIAYATNFTSTLSAIKKEKN